MVSYGIIDMLGKRKERERCLHLDKCVDVYVSMYVRTYVCIYIYILYVYDIHIGNHRHIYI